MIRIPNFLDYFGFGPSKIPAHRGDVTTCPCKRCMKIRGVRDGLRAQTEAVRFVLHLRWWRWIVTQRRKHWPAIHTADREKLEKEEAE